MAGSKENNEQTRVDAHQMQRLNTLASLTGLVTVFLFVLTLVSVYFFPSLFAPPPSTPLPTRTPTLTLQPTKTSPPTATLTPEATATATITPTPTAHPAQVFAEPLLAAVANVRPLFEDDFSKNRGWVWEAWDAAIYDQIKIQDGVVNVNGTGHLWPPNPHTFANCKNLVVEFDILPISRATKMGIDFRREETGGYNFDIDVEGTWNFYRYNGVAEKLRSNQWNRIVLIARGDEFALFLNDLPVFYIKDDDFSKASNLMLTYQGQGQFDNFKLWDLDQVRGLPK